MANAQRFEDLDDHAQKGVIREAIRLDVEGRDDLLGAAREAGVTEAAIQAAMASHLSRTRRSLRELQGVLAVSWAVAIWVSFAFNGTGMIAQGLWAFQVFAVPLFCAIGCPKRGMSAAIAGLTMLSGVIAFVSLLGWPVHDRGLFVCLPFLSAGMAAGLHILIWRRRAPQNERMLT